MRRFLCTGFFFLSAVWTLIAQPVSDSTFRVQMNALVSKGNVCYDRSDRVNKVKEQKKEYVTPAMKIAKLRRQVALLQDSDPPGWGGYGN